MKFFAATIFFLSINGMAAIEGQKASLGPTFHGVDIPVRGVQYYNPFLMEVDKNNLLYLSNEPLVRVPESCRAVFLTKIKLARNRGTWLMIKPRLLDKWRSSAPCCHIELDNLAADLPSHYGISNFLVFKKRMVFQKTSFEKSITTPAKKRRGCSFNLLSTAREKLPTEQYFLNGRRLPTEHYPIQWLVVLDELLFNASVNEIGVFLEPLYRPKIYQELDATILFVGASS